MHLHVPTSRGTFAWKLLLSSVVAVFTGCDKPGPVASPVKPGPVTISQIPYVITNSGAYQLSQDVRATNNGSGIIIRCSNVTIDLNGKTLEGVPGSLAALSLFKGITNVVVRDGTIVNWANSAVVGVFANHCEFSGLNIISNGTGLATGSNIRISNCKAVGNLSAGFSTFDHSQINDCHSESNRDDGIVIGFGSTVDNCTTVSNRVNGVYATQYGTVRNTIASYNNRAGILAGASSTVANCTVTGNAREGIETGSGCTVTGNTASSNRLNGIHVFGHSLVQSNRVVENVRDGIRGGFNNRILDNECIGNARAGRDTGSIHAVLKQNRIENNRITIWEATGIKTSASPNVVVKNIVTRHHGNSLPFDCKGGLPGAVLNRLPSAEDEASSNYELALVEGE